MKIRTYESQYTAQGQINPERATASAFGGDIGAAGSEIADSIDKSAGILTQLADAKDQVWRSNAVSAFQLQQFQNLQTAKTDPDFASKYGADGAQFAPTFNNQLDDGINDLVGTAPSNRSARLLQMQLTGVKDGLMGHAIQFQAEAGGAYIKDQLTESMQNDAKMAAASPGDMTSIADRGHKAISDAPFLTPEHKTEMLRVYDKNLAFAAGKGMVLHNPEALLGQLAPDVIASYKPTPRLVQNAGVPITGFQPAAAAPAIDKYAPVIATNAAKFNVDPNFMKAQLNVESGGNPAAVNKGDIAVTGQPSVGLAQFQPATAAQYGIDPTKPEQSIAGQAMYMSDLLKQFGGDYRKAAAAYNWGPGHVSDAIATYGADWFDHAPDSTKDYINKIFAAAPPVPPADAVMKDAMTQQSTAEPNQSPNNPDWFNKLDWDQQFQIVREAEQGVRANQVRDAQTMAFQKQQHEQQQQKVMNSMFDRIGAKDNPLSVAEVRQSPDLDYQGKEYMINAISKDLNGENKTDPAVFNDLLRRVHSAPGTPGAITNPEDLVPFVGNGIKYDDMKNLRSEIEGKGQPQSDIKRQFFETAHKQISGSNLIANDHEGELQYYNWYVMANQMIDQKTKDGKTNVMDLLNPDNKDYIGGTINAFARSPQQQAQDMAKRLRDTQSVTQPTASNNKPLSPTARQPGESQDDYRKRMLGK